MVSTTLTAADVQGLAQPAESYTGLYADLKNEVKQAGLLDKRADYYVFATIEPFVLLGIGVAILILFSEYFWVQMLNALLFSLAYVRAGFMMHDAGHRQIFKRVKRRNDRIGLLFGNLFLGSSITSWRERHDEHHAHTNELGIDPTLEIPVWAWIEEQIEERKPLIQWIMKHQAYTFFPVLSLSAFFQAVAAVRDVFFGQRVDDRFWQGLCLILHHVLYFGLVFSILPWWQATIFFFVHHLSLGLHLGMVFAPNHKGMPIVNPDHGMDYLYVQCLTTRNVVPSPVVDYLYGGLNYQIEHHLFPSMPRCNLGKARAITKEFCAAHQIPYHETGVVQSYREILQYMHEVGASFRNPETC